MSKFVLRVGIRGFCSSCGTQLDIENAINLQAVPRIVIAKMLEDMERKVAEYPCPRCLAKSDQIQDNWCLNHKRPSVPEIENLQKENKELKREISGLQKTLHNHSYRGSW